MREMREPTWLVLTALAGAERLHGYGIIKDVEVLSQGQLHLRAGTLYATLDRLAAEGLLRCDGEEIVEGRLRRYYCLSAPGRAELAAEAERRERIGRLALRRLSAAEGLA